MKELIVQTGDTGQRLDSYLRKVYPQLPKGLLFKGIRKKKIKVNRQRAELNQRLQEGDRIQIFLPEDALTPKDRTALLHEGPVDVVYEDDNLLCVAKPRGLKSQPDQKGEDSLTGRVCAYIYKRGQWDPQDQNAFAPASASRLDRNTEGLVLFAKNAQTLRELNEAVRDHEIEKVYEARVEGKLPFESRRLEAWLKKGADLKAQVYEHPEEGTQEAAMQVKVLSFDGKHSLVEVQLETGRFHQIRAMLGAIGHPLAGDAKYGSHESGPYKLKARKLVLKGNGSRLPAKTIELA